MEEALEMDGLTLLRKITITGRNPNLAKMKEWARKNWTGVQSEGLVINSLPIINSLAKGWFSFQFRCKEDADLIHSRVWTYGKTPF